MRYLVKAIDGQSYGPVDLDGLRAWAKEGRIEATTEIVEDGTGLVLAASQIPGLLSADEPATPYQSAPSQVFPPPNSQLKAITDDKSPVWWALAALTLTLILIRYGSGGMLISGYAVYSSIKSITQKNRFGLLALIISLISLAIAVMAFTRRD